MHELMRELFPIPRSLTGDGVRATLAVLGRDVPLDVVETPSGDPGIRLGRAARVERPRGLGRGRRTASASSTSPTRRCTARIQRPGRRQLDREELLEHRLHRPARPRCDPYRTSYWSERWGFCMSQRVAEKLPAGDVPRTSTRRSRTGHVTYGEARIAGREPTSSFLLATSICHPALANDNSQRHRRSRPLSPASCLRRHSATRSARLWSPGTIGPLCWLAREPRTGRRRSGTDSRSPASAIPARSRTSGAARGDARRRSRRGGRPRPPRTARRFATGRRTAATSGSSARPASTCRSARSPGLRRTLSPSTTPPRTISSSSARGARRLVPRRARDRRRDRARRGSTSTHRRSASRSSDDAGLYRAVAAARARRWRSSGSLSLSRRRTRAWSTSLSGRGSRSRRSRMRPTRSSSTGCSRPADSLGLESGQHAGHGSLIVRSDAWARRSPNVGSSQRTPAAASGA